MEELYKSLVGSSKKLYDCPSVIKKCQKETDLQIVNSKAKEEKKLRAVSPRDYEAIDWEDEWSISSWSYIYYKGSVGTGSGENIAQERKETSKISQRELKEITAFTHLFMVTKTAATKA